MKLFGGENQVLIYIVCINFAYYFMQICCRTPHGVRGLKYVTLAGVAVIGSRTSHGVRGLKCHRYCKINHVSVVAPRTGCVD